MQALKNGALSLLFFSNINFTTPNQLRLYKKSDGYVFVCSRLLFLSINNRLSKKHLRALKDVMTEFRYWEDLGFDYAMSKEEVLARLKSIETIKKPRDRKPSKAKRLLIESIISKRLHIDNEVLMAMYNGIIYPRIKKLNTMRVKDMQNK